MEYWNRTKDGRGDDDFVIEVDATISVRGKTVRKSDITKGMFHHDCPLMLRGAIVRQEPELLAQCKAKFYPEKPLLQMPRYGGVGLMPSFPPNERIVVDHSLRWRIWSERETYDFFWMAVSLGTLPQDEARREAVRLADLGFDAYRLSCLGLGQIYDDDTDVLTFVDLREDLTPGLKPHEAASWVAFLKAAQSERDSLAA